MIIAVDFDGTLAEYHGFKGVGVYGPPVPAMMERVRKWIADGHTVVIFTSRVSNHGFDRKANDEFDNIRKWLFDNGLPPLVITANKWHTFDEIWDDRAVRVERNTGVVLSTK